MSKRAGDPGYAPGWCIHYRARADTCEAGIAYSLFDGVPFDRRPCFINPHQKPADMAKCLELRPPTPEEIAAHEAWQAKRGGLLLRVLGGIATWRELHRRENFAEVVACPGCGGRLHLAISRTNGHIAGRCETKGCVSWIE